LACCWRNQLALGQIGFSGVIEFGVARHRLRLVQAGAKARQRCRCLVQPRLEGAWIDAGDHLALLHGVVEIHVHALQGSGHLGADFNRCSRAQGAGSRDRRTDLAAFHGGRAIASGAVVAAIGQEPPRGASKDHHDKDPSKPMAAGT
jgi:hypothetical protein